MTQELVKSLFRYDSKKGVLYWRFSPNNSVDISKPAGFLGNRGYRVITYKKKKYLRSRLVFLYHHGYFPKIVDHKNRLKEDDRIENLREVTYSLSSINRRGYCNTKLKYIYYAKKKRKNKNLRLLSSLFP